MPALKSVLHPVVPSWQRAEDTARSMAWEAGGLPEPEELAREALAELQGAIKGLESILELLEAPTLSRSGEAGARKCRRKLRHAAQECGPARDHRR